MPSSIFSSRLTVTLWRGAPVGSRRLALRVRWATPRPAADEPPQETEAAPISTLAVTFTALVSALLTATLIAAFSMGPAEPSRSAESDPEWRRERVAALEELRTLDLRRLALEQRAAATEAEERRITELLRELRELTAGVEGQHDLTLERAVGLGSQIDLLIERSRELASDEGGLPPELRSVAARLGDEAEGYRAVLDRVVTRLEDDRRAAREHAGTIDERLRNRDVRGRTVRVIHDTQRADDAQEVVRLLEQAGAHASRFPTEITEVESHKGRLYYFGPREEAAARQIARLVEEIEPTEIEEVGLANPFLSLWIVGPPPVDLEDEKAVIP